MVKQPRSRLSYAHESPELRAQSALYRQTDPVAQYFNAASDDREARREAFKARRRGETMVERERPMPELKPSPELAADVDRQAYLSKLSAEHVRSEHAALLLEARRAKADLLRDDDKNKSLQADLQAVGADPQKNMKALFKLHRRFKENIRDFEPHKQNARAIGRKAQQITRSQ
ncbi:hypothetical protein [Vannielia sp.]|uniref:hypothetical protein n=1 Tax=Vannielia sp. TaxID=2813045 RepID=UPI0026113550|nr:hypothetical protein [Vannielia sp.]MDF1871987.1 hypothetical protein [Vannielia sp.]